MKKNFVFTAVSIGSRLLTGLVIFVLLARLWGPEDFGLFSFIFSVAALLAMIVDFGFAGYVLRELGAEPAHAGALIKNALWAKLSLVLVFLAASGLLLLSLGSATAPPGLALPLLLAALTLSFADFFVAPMRALGRYDAETIIVTLSNAIQFVIAGSVAWLGGSISNVAWAFVLSRLIYLTAAVIMLRRIMPTLSLRRHGAGHPLATLKRVWPYGIDGALTTAWGQLDVVVVRVLYGAQAVGLYAAGQKIVQGVSALAPVVGNVMIPKLSRLAKTSDARFQRTAVITAGVMLAIGLLFGVPLIVFSELTSHVLFGEKYKYLSQLLPFFALILILKYLAAGAGIVITSAGLQSKRVICQLSAMAVFASGITLVAYSSSSLWVFLLAYAVAVFSLAIFYALNWLMFKRSSPLLGR